MLLSSIRKTDPQLSRSYLRSMVLLLLLLFSSSVISNSCDPVDCSPPGSSIRGISQQKHWSEKKKKKRNTGVGCRFLLQLIVIRWCLLWGHILEYALHLAVAIVQSLSRVQLFATLQIAAPPGFPVLHNLPEFAQIMSIESIMLSNHLILCHPLLLLPSIFPSTRVFSNESALHIR